MSGWAGPGGAGVDGPGGQGRFVESIMQSDPSPGAAGAAAASARPRWSDPTRERALEAWLAPLVAAHGLQPHTLRLASADASFRRYLRVDAEAGRGPTSLIVMDAPPPQENCRPFVAIDHLLASAGVNVPQIHAQDLERGFLLLGDLGDRLLLRCSREDLLRKLDNGRIKPFRRVILETTGLADPAPILHAIMYHPYLLLRFRLDGVIAVVRPRCFGRAHAR